MAHLAGIDKGPVLDWTDDNGLLEHGSENGRRKWRFSSEGPLATTNDAVKCNYIIHWSSEDRHGASGQMGNQRQNQ